MILFIFSSFYGINKILTGFFMLYNVTCFSVYHDMISLTTIIEKKDDLVAKIWIHGLNVTLGVEATRPSWPDIVVFLDIDLMKHHVFLLGIDVSLHLHGNMPRQHWKQQTFLEITKKKQGNADLVSQNFVVTFLYMCLCLCSYYPIIYRDI